jgi:hypothetical protein
VGKGLAWADRAVMPTADSVRIAVAIEEADLINTITSLVSY